MSSGRKRGQIEASRKKLKEIRKQLREHKKAQGLEPAANATLPNRVCGYESVAEEKQARLEAVTEQVKILRGKLPILLRRLRNIPDPRNPRKIKQRHERLSLPYAHRASTERAGPLRCTTSPYTVQLRRDLFLLYLPWLCLDIGTRLHRSARPTPIYHIAGSLFANVHRLYLMLPPDPSSLTMPLPC
ncbi:hypothetical protein ES705_45145 [subsurface metagenome]